MSAIFGLVGGGQRLIDAAAMRQVVEEVLHCSGGDRSELEHGVDHALAVARAGWEMEPDFSGDVLVLREGEIALVAHATLFYRSDLVAKLSERGVVPTGGTSSHLIVAAYRAWGERCAEQLEGEYSFILWDGTRRRMVAARDYVGRRPLYFADVPGGFLVATRMSILLAHPATGRDLSAVSLASTIGGLYAPPTETPYLGVRTLPAGSTVVFGAAEPALRAHWEPPRFRDRGGQRFETAAEELREVLMRATRERMPAVGPAAISMSGGWDSTSVFAAGRQALQDGGGDERLVPVSISYPPGDPGREDELIQAVADRWHSRVHWLDIDTIPLIDPSLQRPAERDDAWAHLFGGFNRALFQGARDVGARVMLDGNGGDLIFQVSDVLLADLFWAGRWLELRRQWISKGAGGSGFRNFARWAIQPAMPPTALRAVALLRGGKRPADWRWKQTPPWIRKDFVRMHGLLEREATVVARSRGESLSAFENRHMLLNPQIHRSYAAVQELATAAQVESRSPLLDERVIAFAAGRPRDDRSSGPETKRLLRAAMRGLIPDEVLAPRAYRTGVTGAYFARCMERDFPDPFRESLKGSVLAELGILEPAEAHRALERYLRAPRKRGLMGMQLFQLWQVELWVRERLVAETSEVADMTRVATVGKGR